MAALGAVSSPILLGLGIGMSSRDRRRLSDQEATGDGGQGVEKVRWSGRRFFWLKSSNIVQLLCIFDGFLSRDRVDFDKCTEQSKRFEHLDNSIYVCGLLQSSSLTV